MEMKYQKKVLQQPQQMEAEGKKNYYEIKQDHFFCFQILFDFFETNNYSHVHRSQYSFSTR